MKAIELSISAINNLEDIKARKSNLNEEKEKVVRSAADNGQQVPISIDSVNNVVDGELRVLGLLEKGADTVQAIVVDGDENELAKTSYIVNMHRQKLSAVKQADLYQNSVKGKSKEESDDISLSLQVKTSNEDKKDYSKAHKSKYKAISKMSDDIKEPLDFYMTPIGTAYEIARLSKDGMSDDIIKQLIKNIADKKMSDRKAISFLKKYKKDLDNVSLESEGVDNTVDSAIKFSKKTITIDVTKHFDSNFTIKDITDEDKTNIRNLINKVFEYLRNNLNTESSSDQTSQEDVDTASNQESNISLIEQNSQPENQEETA
jgi:hypothetical protein